ncbi:unnamed protein product, partial [Discosporangium mesarthrocarpum]
MLALVDGHCCPPRSKNFVRKVVAESMVTQGHLDLWMKDLSPLDCQDILKSMHKGNQELRKLTIGSSHTAGAGVGRFLQLCPGLKELELEWEGVRDLTNVALSMASHKSLVRLNLTHNEVGPRGASQLAQALRTNKSLTELDLRENNLGPMGMKAIADALADNDTIRSLHVQDNGIGDDGVIAMTEALMRNGRLRTVCLDGNEVSEVGAKVICIAIKMNPALRLLSLSRNALPDESKMALIEAWHQREVEQGEDQTGMYLEKAADGTDVDRNGWGRQSSSVGVGGGQGVLVSPSRD